ncbi:lysophospholipid acyltransferase family protein [Candidatus Pelagibacter sp.]|nr:lysophospholipid acyltransferase family protein [Candidatus Pelagibacter sp.]|tara:strand:+ start:1315 stop:2178 length:864 start_codon:yes stop_codon:yes gene_type:complete
MIKLKYLLQFIFIFILFLIFKLIGIKLSRLLSGKILTFIGPLFRSNKIPFSNLSYAYPELNVAERKKIIDGMWFNYGKILSEYMFIKDFRKEKFFNENIIIENFQEIIKIKNDKRPVVFISGHFNNFELMALCIEKSGVNLAAIYRPLNNIFLNPIMEKIRKNYICKNQIKKGISGTKELLKKFKMGTSIALMIDQRVSEGIPSNFFNKKALTTTIPAQFVKKFNAEIVPVYIERLKDDKFKIKFHDSLKFHNQDTLEKITLELNNIIEKMILKNPDQWIWTHNRWK